MRTNRTAARDAGHRASTATTQVTFAGGPDRRFVLADGRVIGYRVFGAANGFPVLALHGTPGSRLKYAAGHAEAERLSLQLISPDRWGYGLSDPHPQPALARYADDVAEFARGLSLSRFSVVGISGGGPFAIAVAAALGEQIRSVALVAPVGPIAGALDAHKLRPFHRLCFRWLGPASRVMRPCFALYRALLSWAPDVAVPLIAAGGPRVDKLLVSAPEVRYRLIETFRAGFERGVTGALIDMQLFSRPWQVAFERITARTRIWLGTEDRNVPQLAVYWLVQRIPRVEFTKLEGEGHLWISRHYGEVLEWLAEEA